jgi:uncharacterized protein YbjT (DUF2867 family)
MLVTGASGFVGSALGRELEARGQTVRAMTRRPERYRGAGAPVYGDIADEASLAAALDGVDAAYYLVHSLASADFAERDRAGAKAFATAAARAGVGRVVYLGGLGENDDHLSAHLRSRAEVGRILASEVPTTTLRAGIVVGDGGISWEILVQLVERLPAMITPRWVDTRCQPVGLDDVVAALCGVVEHGEPFDEAETPTFDVGGPDVLTYREMLALVARMTGRLRLILPIPLLSPRLSSHWLRLITDVDLATARSLVDSLTNEVVAHDDRIWTRVERRPAPFAECAADALRSRAARRARAAHAPT